MKYELFKEIVETPGSRFMSLTYTNKQKETAQHLLHLGVRIDRVWRRDLRILQAYKPTNELEKVARQELIDSLKASISGFNPNYTKTGYYSHITNDLKYHDDQVYINAYSISKKVLIPGEKKEVNSSPKTLAKNKLRKMMKSSNFREFRIDLTQVHKAKLNGTTIEVITKPSKVKSKKSTR